MKFGSASITLTLSLLMVFGNVRNAAAVYGSIDLLPIMKKSIHEGKDIPVDIFTKNGDHLGLAIFNEEDGLWYFDFPDRKSHYEAKWRGGSAGLVSPFMSNTETVVVGSTALIATLAGAIAVTNTSSSSKPAGELAVPSCSELRGVYAVAGPKVEDTCSSVTDNFNGAAQVRCDSGFLTMQSRATMTGNYTDSGTIRASGTDSLTQPLQTEGDTGTDTGTDTGDGTGTDTGGTGDTGIVTLTVFRETFAGIARKELDGKILFNGRLVFAYSEQFGTSELCQTVYDVVFTKR